MILTFGDFALDTALFELRERGELRKVEPMVFDLLVHFARHPDQVFSNQQLIDVVWSGRIVSDATVATCIKGARRVLGDSGDHQEWIRTVRGRGFRFMGAMIRVETALGDEPRPDTNPQQSVAGTELLPIGGRPSIAVLPLQNRSGDPDRFLFGDAIAQEIIVDLSRLHWLSVVARGSSFQFRDPEVDLPAASRILGARYFLTGSLESFMNLCVVTVEFVDGPHGRVLWADQFECKLDELLRLRHSIAARIVSEIEHRVQQSEAERAATLPTEDLDAWSAYHRGLWHMYRFNREHNEQARNMFLRAVAADGQFARAYSSLSFTHFQNAFLRYADNTASEQVLARQYAQKGLELDPLDPFVNLTMGRSAWLDHDLESAGTWLDRGLQLSPNYSFAMYNRALIDVLMNDGERSEKHVSSAMALSPIDPLNYAMFCTRALSHLVRGDFEQAVAWVNRSVREPTAHVHILFIAALTHEIAGAHGSAVGLMSRVREMTPGYTFAHFLRAFPFCNDRTVNAMSDAFDRLSHGRV